MKCMGLHWRNIYSFASISVFNFAFFIPQCAFLIILFPVLVFKAQPKTFKSGFLLGVLIFGPNMFWIMHVMTHHSHAPWWLSVLGYLVVVVYGALTCGAWCAITKRVPGFVRALSPVGYWIFVEYFFLWPVGIPLGYPFLNPCIPLAQYPCFLRGVSLIAVLLGNPVQESVVESVVHVPPVWNRVLNTHAPWAQSAQGVGQKVYQLLVCNDGHYDRASILVSPETMFRFSLNNYSDVVKLLSSALQEDQHWFLGSVYRCDKKAYQAVYWLQGERAQESPIKNIYVKKVLMPFAEYTPRLWRWTNGLQEQCLGVSDGFYVPTGILGIEFFDVTPTQRIVPRICLEFFLANSFTEFRRYQESRKNIVVYAFINDSWYPEIFRQWMRGCAALKASLANVPVVMIGHFECCCFRP